jgi:large subunit ribosomal protein L29
MKAIDLRKKSNDDLGKELVDLRKAQLNSRMQITTQQSSQNDHLGKIK